VHSGDVDSAITDFKKALEIDPDNVVAHRMLIQAYQIQGKVEETLPLFRKLVPQLGEDPGLWVQYGIMARRAGEYETAVHALQQSLELRPSPIVRLELAVALGMAERWDAAAGIFRALLKDDKLRGRATLGLATTSLLRAQKDPELSGAQRIALLGESRTHLEAYLSENPDEQEARQTLQRVKALLESAEGKTGE
jgi:tetratricopeptide (TPR) repeat protein